ncbi:hypothetical protein BH11PSE4_BH11PSE4_08180 [soil metagenome]
MLRRRCVSLALFLLAGLCGTVTFGFSARAETTTACTALNICYCINAANKPAIETNIATIRQLLAEQRSSGKSIGYLSIPLSSAGGSYFGINREVALQTKAAVEKQFGADAVWLLNPGANGQLPAGASGADYMYMWTSVLEGIRGIGEDFDFFYFTGPREFARFFGFTGDGDMTRLDSYFDNRLATDPDFKKAVESGKLSKFAFRNYYGLRAAVTFSYGSHDEWNIARLLNERRRGAAAFGIAQQLPILFDGQAVNPGGYESAVASGDVGRCIN